MMMPTEFLNVENPALDSITVKVEHPEYGPMQTCTTATELHSEKFIPDVCEPEPLDNYLSLQMREESVLGFVETSIDKFLAPLQDTSLEAERQRIYRLNETDAQREKRLSLAREYIKERRYSETEQERYERLKKQRERIKAVRQARKLNPEMDEFQRKLEAERMKMRRANETPIQRMIRLEKSKMYSRRRRADQVYRAIENEKNRIAHQNKRADETFRSLESEKDRARRKIKRNQYEEKPAIEIFIS